MKKLLALTLIVLLTLFYETKADETFPFNYDYSVFREESSSVFVEFYYAFDPHFLVFQKAGSGFEANARIELEIIRKSDSKLISKDFKIPLQLADTSGTNKDIKLTGQINMILDTGAYVMKLVASDFNDPKKISVSEEPLNLASFPADRVSISSIQLSTGIVKSSDANSIFYKNTLEVTPNPSALFGNNISTLHYYAELYGLSKEILGEKYTVIAAIEDNSGKELKNTSKSFESKTESKVEFGSFDISDLPSNKYTILIKVIDSKQKESIKTSKIFYIYNSNVTVPLTDMTDFEQEYLMSEYPAMSVEQVDDEFEKAIYIMSYNQKEQYKSLKIPEARKMYMYKYWKGMQSFVTKKDYLSRVAFADKHFTDDFRTGWKTDRGRIYCIYGKYDDIQRYPYEGSTRAYEIWLYNTIQGGVQFVFIDMSAGYGDYTLVHSTALNETTDDRWQQKLIVK